jgi:hypothetical protein
MLVTAHRSIRSIYYEIPATEFLLCLLIPKQGVFEQYLGDSTSHIRSIYHDTPVI